MLFDLGGTAKSRNFAHVRAHRRPVHGSLAFSVSQVHRLVIIYKIHILLRPKSQKHECPVPKTNVLTRALICPFLDLYPTYNPTGEVQVLQKHGIPSRMT
jgi:hypothetical protein